MGGGKGEHSRPANGWPPGRRRRQRPCPPGRGARRRRPQRRPAAGPTQHPPLGCHTRRTTPSAAPPSMIAPPRGRRRRRWAPPARVGGTPPHRWPTTHSGGGGASEGAAGAERAHRDGPSAKAVRAVNAPRRGCRANCPADRACVGVSVPPTVKGGTKKKKKKKRGLTQEGPPPREKQPGGRGAAVPPSALPLKRGRPGGRGAGRLSKGMGRHGGDRAPPPRRVDGVTDGGGVGGGWRAGLGACVWGRHRSAWRRGGTGGRRCLAPPRVTPGGRGALPGSHPRRAARGAASRTVAADPRQTAPTDANRQDKRWLRRPTWRTSRPRPGGPCGGVWGADFFYCHPDTASTHRPSGADPRCVVRTFVPVFCKWRAFPAQGKFVCRPPRVWPPSTALIHNSWSLFFKCVSICASCTL